MTANQQTLLDYWLSLPRRTHDLVPCKNDISLPKLAKIARFLGMAEDRGQYDLLVRLFGTSVEENIGKQSSQNAFDHYTPDSRDWFHAYFRNIFDTPVSLRHDMAFHFEKTPLWIQKVFHLPLADEAGQCRFIISVFEPGELIGNIRTRRTQGLLAADSIHNLQMIDIGAGTGAELPDVPNDQLMAPMKVAV